MSEPSKNPQAGYAADAYPLAALTRSLPPLPAYQAFVAAARLGSVSRAAEHLCRTQGAVSRQIQQIEAHGGHALFLRHATGLRLTAAGEALLAVATQALALLGAQQAPAATLSLRLPSTFAIRWLLPRRAALDAALGGIVLRIRTSADDRPDFSADEVDAMVVRGAGQWPGIEAVPLFAERLAPMCSPALAASLGAPADLARATLLHGGHGDGGWRGWLEQAGATGVDARAGLMLDTLELSLTAATEGHGVAIGDPRMARERLAAGQLLMPFGAALPNGLGYYLVYPVQRAREPRIRALARALTGLAAEEADGAGA
ncbi:LysR substrate-binding domain-containing protein [Burkholderia gladioli]|uniref:LysR substrate-binding domain-containing protein n=1 Tax=Burkholderia gladioli TaxID=28095 RepID=UPI000CFF2E95|nr:LysR substrate-binding domain-containing protein [Burkholderia gladioli]MDN7462427.1 LysR substrate-binding domain-containing protein [Burkholderia gladioli]PRG50999.1 LysR family transcriptional regulator [Burkholderia gladioli]